MLLTTRVRTAKIGRFLKATRVHSTRRVRSSARTMPIRRKDKVYSLGADTESEDESDSDDKDFSAPIGRNTLCALNNGFTKVNRGTAWEAAQITDQIDSAADKMHLNSFEALNDSDDSETTAQLKSWVHGVK